MLRVQQLRKALPVIDAQDDHGLTPHFLTLLRELAEELRQVDDRTKVHDKRIQAAAREDHRIRRLLEIEGIGPVSASALVAAVGDAKPFASGRDIAAWLGLVPSQHSSGGQQRLGAISKRGNTYLRTLLIHGACAALHPCGNKEDARSKWAHGLATRRNRNIATVALTNKNARIAWAVLSIEED